jgi:hypothetical protein
LENAITFKQTLNDMKQKIIILLIAGISALHLHGQVGIKTENPNGAFHIDGKGDNPKNGAIPDAQKKDDLSVHSSSGSMNLGVGAIPGDDSAVQLELGGDASAFLPNRVALTGISDIVTVPNPEDGMIVYNTTNNAGAGLAPGLYTFYDNKWNEILTKEVASVIERRDLWVTSGNGVVTPVTNSNAHERPARSTILLWADPATNSTNQPFITLPETGSYVFSFRFYMDQSGDGAENNRYRSVLYLWALKGNNNFSSADNLPSGVTVEDGAEINMIAYPTVTAAENRKLTTSITLTASGNKGDKISFRIGATTTSGIYTGHPIAAALQMVPSRTSMLFWKL